MCTNLRYRKVKGLWRKTGQDQGLVFVDRGQLIIGVCFPVLVACQAYKQVGNSTSVEGDM